VSRGINKAGRAGTQIFPETAKELARRVGLREKVYLLKAVEKDDGGGNYETEYVRNAEPIRATIESYKRSKPRGVVGAQINEFADHVLTLDQGTDVEARDRIERSGGAIWEVLTVENRTDEPTTRVLTKEVI